MNEIRNHLISFIKSVQKVAKGGVQLRTHMVVGDDIRGVLWFGYGYFAPDKVLWWPPKDSAGVQINCEEVTVEQGVDSYLANFHKTET